VRNQPLEKFLTLTPQGFKTQFVGSAILRAKWNGFIRNVCVAMGNSGEKAFIPLLEKKLEEPEPLIRGHAVWAYSRLCGKAGSEALKSLQGKERDYFVLEEIEAANRREFFSSS
jgi:epoxyqueuosine reductase